MKKTYKGSMTVEAAFIMPIVIFVLVGIVILSFYLFNRMKAENDVDWLLFNAEKQTDILDRIQKKTGGGYTDSLNGYLNSKNSEGTLFYNDGELIADVKVHMNIIKIPIINLERVQEISVRNILEIINPAERARQIMAIYHAADFVKSIWKK